MEKLNLVLSGRISNLVKKEYEGKETLTLQFLNMKNDKLEIVDVKVDENVKNQFEKVKSGDEVKLDVDINVYNNKVYYKTLGLVK